MKTTLVLAFYILLNAVTVHAGDKESQANTELQDLSAAQVMGDRKEAAIKAPSMLVDASRTAKSAKQADASLPNILGMRINDKREVHLEIVGPDEAPVVDSNLVVSHGGTITGAWRNRTELWLPLDRVEDLARLLPEGYLVQPLGAKLQALMIDTEGQGPSIMNTDLYRDLGFDGTGIKIAVIDIGYAGLSESWATNDAPTPFEFTSYNYTNSSLYDVNDGSHGRFVMETVYDHAPGADYIIMKVDGQADVGAAIDDAIAEGANIISMSLGWWPNLSGQVDTVSTAFELAADAGILALNSAGNSAEEHYQGQFEDNDNDQWHNWVGDTDEALAIILDDGDSFSAALTWDRSGGDHDYDFFIFGQSAAQILVQSNASGETYEFVNLQNNTGFPITIHLGILRISGPGTELEVYSGGGTWQQHAVAGGSLLSPSSAAHSNCLSVGAVERVSYGSAKYSNNIAATYSSRGPTNEGVFGPDICAPTSTGGSFFDFFTGTSCACPHAAGMAASLWSANPAGTATQVRQHLYLWAANKDWGNVGADYTYGRGGLSFPSHTDCNSNNWPDAFDISSGGSEDENNNNEPDECEVPGYGFGWLAPNNPPVNPLDGSGNTILVGTIGQQAVLTSVQWPYKLGYMAFEYPPTAVIQNVEIAPGILEKLGAAPAVFDVVDTGNAILIYFEFGNDPATGAPLTIEFDTLTEVIVVEVELLPSATGGAFPESAFMFVDGAGGSTNAINQLVNTADEVYSPVTLEVATIQPVAQSSFLYRLENVDTVVEYDAVATAVEFDVPIEVVAVQPGTAEASAVAMALKHDSNYLEVLDLALYGEFESSSPDVVIADFGSEGLSLQVAWNAVGGGYLFPVQAERVATARYRTISTLLVGDTDGVSTAIDFDMNNGLLVSDNRVSGFNIDEVPFLQGGLVHLTPELVEFRRGDVDGDGLATIGDAINLLSHLFSGGADPQCLDSADVNDDGSISIADAISLLSVLFSGGSVPPAPGLDNCGIDPSPDSLDCQVYNCL